MYLGAVRNWDGSILQSKHGAVLCSHSHRAVVKAPPSSWRWSNPADGLPNSSHLHHDDLHRGFNINCGLQWLQCFLSDCPNRFGFNTLSLRLSLLTSWISFATFGATPPNNGLGWLRAVKQQQAHLYSFIRAYRHINHLLFGHRTGGCWIHLNLHYSRYYNHDISIIIE